MCSVLFGPARGDHAPRHHNDARAVHWPLGVVPVGRGGLESRTRDIHPSPRVGYGTLWMVKSTKNELFSSGCLPKKEKILRSRGTF